MKDKHSFYQVVWDNGHASGVLSGIYDSEETALAAAKDWVTEMESVDPEGKGCYEFEVIDMEDK